MRKLVCHDPCSESIQQQIKDALGKIQGVVETVYFQPDVDLKKNVGRRGASARQEEIDQKHRFLISLVIPCPLKNQPSLEAESAKRTSRRKRKDAYGSSAIDDDDKMPTLVANFVESQSTSSESEHKSADEDDYDRDLFKCLEDLDMSSDNSEMNLGALKNEPFDPEMEENMSNWETFLLANGLSDAKTVDNSRAIVGQQDGAYIAANNLALPSGQSLEFTTGTTNPVMTTVGNNNNGNRNSPITSDYHSDSQNKDGSSAGSTQDEADTTSANNPQSTMMTLAKVKTELPDEADIPLTGGDEIFELPDGSGFEIGSDLWDKLNEYVSGPEDAPGLFPLSPEKLHATIDEQLKKSSSENPNNFDCSLFNDVPTSNKTSVSGHEQEQGSAKAVERYITIPFPGENSIGSNVNANAGTQIIIASSMHQQYPCNQQPSMSPVMSQIATFSLASPSQQHKFLRPAVLPAASTLVNGGNYVAGNRVTVNVSTNRTFPTNTSPKATIIRLPKPGFRLIQGHPRPSLLLPKANNVVTSTSTAPTPTTSANRPTVTTNLRSRKTSPLVPKSGATTVRAKREEEKAQFNETPRTVPEGHTYESWILQEGLHKARKLGLHRNADKDFFPFTCPLCDKKYRNPNGIKYHAKYAHGPKCIFTCEICDKTYATRHGLAAHRRAHEAAKIAKELELECERQRNQKKTVTVNVVQQQPPYESQVIQTLTLHRGSDDAADDGNNSTDETSSVILTTIKSEPMDFE